MENLSFWQSEALSSNDAVRLAASGIMGKKRRTIFAAALGFRATNAMIALAMLTNLVGGALS